MKNLKFKKISPPLQHGSSKVISPRFSPRLINNMNQTQVDETTTPSNLRSSSTNLFRAFSSSPTPSKEKELFVVNNPILEESESGEDERSIITPPLRTSNPIIFNSPFRKMIEKRDIPSSNVEIGIGLLSISPTPIDLVESNEGGDEIFMKNNVLEVSQERIVVTESPYVDVVNSFCRSRLHSVEEIDELLFRFDSS